jgi:hypothetical protein
MRPQLCQWERTGGFILSTLLQLASLRAITDHLSSRKAFLQEKGAIFGYWTVYFNSRRDQTWYALESEKMYEDIRRYQNLRNLRKERFLRMQTLTRPNYSPANSNTTDSQALRVAVLAVILFALSGLITGFAFGAFVHFSPAKTSNATNNITTIQQKTGSATPIVTRKANPIPLGVPSTLSSSYIETADGSTVYNVKTQVTDQANGVATQGKALQASGITCKLWLTKDKNVTDMLKENNYQIPKSVTALQQPFPDEVQGGLVFANNTPQTQMCNSSGQASWSYTINPSVKSGRYTLAVITDWDGQHFNWGWVYITIKQTN